MRRLWGWLPATLVACGGLVRTLDEPPFVDDVDAGMTEEGGAPRDGAPPSVRDASSSDASLGEDAGETFDAGDDAGASVDAGDAAAGCNGPGARFVTAVIDHAFGPGQNHNQTSGFPQALYGTPVAGDARSVVSLGNGGYVTVEFGGNAIVDGPGPDFTVFENPLRNFVELATVAVSEDGIVWHEFPCDAAQDADDYGFCAGVEQVFSRPDNGVDPLDPAVSGGDIYDLADIGVARARYVRITDRVDLDGLDGVFDLDAVAILNAECP